MYETPVHFQLSFCCPICCTPSCCQPTRRFLDTLAWECSNSILVLGRAELRGTVTCSSSWLLTLRNCPFSGLCCGQYHAHQALLSAGSSDSPQPGPAHAQPACPGSSLTGCAAQPSRGPTPALKMPAGACWSSGWCASFPAPGSGLRLASEGRRAGCVPCQAGSAAALPHPEGPTCVLLRSAAGVLPVLWRFPCDLASMQRCRCARDAAGACSPQG